METGKAFERRLNSGWYEKFAPSNKSGLDIGSGNDPLQIQPGGLWHEFDRIHNPQHNAQRLPSDFRGRYHTVYASHILEHLQDPVAALRSWWSAVKDGGHLIIVVPHRDFYEQKTDLPSRWNKEHKTFWLPDRSEPPCTFSLLHTLQDAIPAPQRMLRLLSVETDGYQPGNLGAGVQSTGEYSIEAVVYKVPAELR